MEQLEDGQAKAAEVEGVDVFAVTAWLEDRVEHLAGQGHPGRAGAHGRSGPPGK